MSIQIRIDSKKLLPPALPATKRHPLVIKKCVYSCSSLIVSDTAGEGSNNAWTKGDGQIEAGVTFALENMFYGCQNDNGRASDNFAGQKTYVYYTQNAPVTSD